MKIPLLTILFILSLSLSGLSQAKPFYIAGAGTQFHVQDESVYYPHDRGYFIGGGGGLIFKKTFAISLETRCVYLPYNGDTEYLGDAPCVWPPINPIEIRSDPSCAVELDLLLRITDYRPLSTLVSNRGFYLKLGFGLSCIRRGELRNRYLRDDGSTYIKVDEPGWGIAEKYILFGSGFEYRFSDNLAMFGEFSPRLNLNRYDPVIFTVPVAVGFRF